MQTWKLRVVLALALAVLPGACEKNDGGGPATTDDVSAAEDAAVEVAPDAAPVDVPSADSVVPVCPNETELSAYLPCTCYGKLVTDPDARKPGCRSQVVCCPTCQGLRCEDHEIYDVTDDCVPPDAGQPEPAVEPAPEVVDEVAPEPQPEVTEAVEEIAAAPACPYEVDLATATLPCDCGGILVSSLAHALPGCTKKIVCCPLGGLKCE